MGPTTEMWLVELEDSQVGPNTMMLFTKESYAYDWVEREYPDGSWDDAYAGQAYFVDEQEDPLAYIRKVNILK